ncbi:MAG: hypothetical protein AAFW73_09370 [Bacteroidota bacterium]
MSKNQDGGGGATWSGKKAEETWISLEGRQFQRVNGNRRVKERPYEIESETDSGNVQRNITDDDDPRIYPDQLWSTHQMKVNGQILSYTKNGGKLFLN